MIIKKDILASYKDLYHDHSSESSRVSALVGLRQLKMAMKSEIRAKKQAITIGDLTKPHITPNHKY